MEDHDPLNDLDTGAATNEPPKIQSTEGEGTPIPSRIRDAMQDVKRRVSEELHNTRDIVDEYEQRYYGSRRRLEDSSAPSVQTVSPYKAKRAHDPAMVDANERKWAALAHASTLLTALVALGSAGAGVLLTMFVPLLIYFAFRNRSEFVAFHALQAFTIVSQAPWGMNVESNSGSSDLTHVLFVAERWPPRTWGSLLERALSAAEQEEPSLATGLISKSE